MKSMDEDWEEMAKKGWKKIVESYTPPTLSLDWSFMNTLPAEELSRTYGWYQCLLDLKAAEIYKHSGLDFIIQLKEQLDLDMDEKLTNDELLTDLDKISPGIKQWANDLENGRVTY